MVTLSEGIFNFPSFLANKVQLKLRELVIAPLTHWIFVCWAGPLIILNSFNIGDISTFGVPSALTATILKPSVSFFEIWFTSIDAVT